MTVFGIIPFDKLREIHPKVAKGLADSIQDGIEQAVLEGTVDGECAFYILDALRGREKESELWQ